MSLTKSKVNKLIDDAIKTIDGTKLTKSQKAQIRQDLFSDIQACIEKFIEAAEDEGLLEAIHNDNKIYHVLVRDDDGKETLRSVEAESADSAWVFYEEEGYQVVQVEEEK